MSKCEEKKTIYGLDFLSDCFKLLPVYSKVCFFCLFLFCMFVLIILVDNIFLLADLLCFPLSLKTSERIYCLCY